MVRPLDSGQLNCSRSRSLIRSRRCCRRGVVVAARGRYKNAKQIVSSGSEFASGEEYRHHIRRHTRMKGGPTDKYGAPITATQDIGWRAHEAELKPPDAPKKSCDETVYAAELIKSGVFY
jgi:hypothetical protein